jgi:2-(1,2-epoxy-1,2-dihydrophenyl)acetyl-CoA isomerase
VAIFSFTLTGGEMNKHRSFEYEDSDFKSYSIDNVGVIKIKQNVFEIVTDLSESSEILISLDSATRDSNMDALLLLNESGCFGEDEYDNYFKKIMTNEIEDESVKNLNKSVLRSRQINILNHFISKIFNFNKPVIAGLSGCIVIPFFGASLAADFRYSKKNTYFCMSHTKCGVHPSGALPFFLPKYVGRARATELLMKGGNIEAEEAVQLNLINEVLPENNFEKLCIGRVLDLLSSNSSILNITKRLLNESTELENYIKKESDIINIL